MSKPAPRKSISVYGLVNNITIYWVITLVSIYVLYRQILASPSHNTFDGDICCGHINLVDKTMFCLLNLTFCTTILYSWCHEIRTGYTNILKYIRKHTHKNSPGCKIYQKLLVPRQHGYRQWIHLNRHNYVNNIDNQHKHVWINSACFIHIWGIANMLYCDCFHLDDMIKESLFPAQMELVL